MELRKQLYAGRTIIFKQLPSALLICRHFQEFLLENFSNIDLNDISSINDDTVTRMCDTFEHPQSPVRGLWRSIIHEAKVHSDSNRSDVSWDRVRLRVQRSNGRYDDVSDPRYRRGRFSATLKLHRDTWANNVQQQINWWMPLLPVSERRTLAVCPSFFKIPVENDSEYWSIEDALLNRTRNLPYPQLPTVRFDDLSDQTREDIARDMTPIVIDPGDVLLFSGAHLHGSTINDTGITRFSSEIRTVDFGDISSGIGAPNVDGNCKEYNLQWFKAMA